MNHFTHSQQLFGPLGRNLPTPSLEEILIFDMYHVTPMIGYNPTPLFSETFSSELWKALFYYLHKTFYHALYKTKFTALKLCCQKYKNIAIQRYVHLYKKSLLLSI